MIQFPIFAGQTVLGLLTPRGYMKIIWIAVVLMDTNGIVILNCVQLIVILLSIHIMSIFHQMLGNVTACQDFNGVMTPKLVFLLAELNLLQIQMQQYVLILSNAHVQMVIYGIKVHFYVIFNPILDFYFELNLWRLKSTMQRIFECICQINKKWIQIDTYHKFNISYTFQ